MHGKYIINGPVTQEDIKSILDGMSGRSDAGGHTFFLGQVRADTVDGKRVKAIEYSNYEGLIGVEMEKIRCTIFEEFGDVKSIDIMHSTGIVKVGEISLLVAVSAGHRKQAIEACNRAVELAKERLPVWKKEIYEDSSHTWK